MQLADARHAVPHAPQFAASFDVSTHDEPHCVRPSAQADWHEPSEQVSPALHACAHEPQFFGSLVASTQWPEHET